MEFLKLTIENFLTIKDATLQLDNRGLVLIQGENVDDPSAKSNGAGKSTIPDALCWCLYGKTARGESGDDVINNVEKKNCRVKVIVRDGDVGYIIVRYRKHRVGKNSLTIESFDAKAWSSVATCAMTDLSKGTDKMTQEVVDQVMGATHDVFVATIYAGQEAMPDLPAMTDKQLKVLVEESAGIDRLKNAYEFAKQRKLQADKLTLVDRERLETAKALEKSTQEEQKRLAEQRIAWDEVTKKSVMEMLCDLKKLSDDTKALSMVANPEEVKRINSELMALESQLLNRKLEEREEEKLRLALREADLEVARKEMSLSLVGTEVRKRKAEAESVQSRIGLPCGECGKAYTGQDVAGAKAIADQNLADELKKLSDVRAEISRARQDCETVKDSLKSFRDTMTDVSAVIAAQSVLRNEKSALEAQIARYEMSKQKTVDLAEKIKIKKAEANPFGPLIEAASKRLVDVSKKKSEAIAALEKSANMLALTESAVEIFGPAGVRAHILDTVTPFLNDRTSDYLGSLSDGNISAVWSTIGATAKGDLREKFNIEVKHEKGGTKFGLLSGGEKRKVRLATAMALQDLVASRAVKPINLFIADEVDHALDEAGLERLMGILDQKAKDRGTVLVISHNELSDWIREQVTVIKEGGFSRVEGVLT